MTDPQNPDIPPPPPGYGAPPPAPTPPAYGQPAYGQPAQPAYSAAPPAPYGDPAAGPTIPGKTMGIVAFILSFFIQIVALILGIIALVQSRKAGHKNGWALAAIIISSVLIVVGIIIAIIAISIGVAAAGEIARLCAEYGTGTHEINGVPITLDCG
ncbi:DUF4190 domain-containing protein [Microbacterium sp.]|uniref:DUF4190 domain-containing protein n=1 Tax=Microbacterium sp. TaxID=51671 RepID=UPI002E367679|nr:DUF4190 domain-containing protein [Microbacterium sp.]HEX5729377.1 DUF4190 domain-containing protein [Microbacterium sp.]